MPFSCSCASSVVYYYFQGFSAGHKRIISYSSTWQKYFIFPRFQRRTQVKVIVTWFIIIWMDDGELIVFDGASCNGAYETKYKLTGNAFSEVKNLSCDSVMCSLNHPQNRWYQHFHSSDHKGKTIGLHSSESGNESWILKNPSENSQTLFFVVNILIFSSVKLCLSC